MRITFKPKGLLEIDDARIMWRNFAGRAGQYNAEGEGEFTWVIEDGTVVEMNGNERFAEAAEIAEILKNDVNRFGAGWNVRIRTYEEEGKEPLLYMKVKVRFNEWGPNLYLATNGRLNKLSPESAYELDRARLTSVRMDIAPSDREVRGSAYRTAYLRSIRAEQEIDRFEMEYAMQEFPGEEEMPF